MRKRSPPRLQPRMDENQVYAGATWVLQPVRDWEWWNVVESNVALWATAFHTKSACSHPKGCAGGGDAGVSFDGGPDGAETVRAATEGNLPPVMPEGNLGEVLGRDVRCQGN